MNRVTRLHTPNTTFPYTTLYTTANMDCVTGTCVGSFLNPTDLVRVGAANRELKDAITHLYSDVIAEGKLSVDEQFKNFLVKICELVQKSGIGKIDVTLSFPELEHSVIRFMKFPSDLPLEIYPEPDVGRGPFVLGCVDDMRDMFGSVQLFYSVENLLEFLHEHPDFLACKNIEVKVWRGRGDDVSGLKRTLEYVSHRKLMT